MIIDLSVLLNNSSPVYPGDPTVEMLATTSHAEEGYEIHQITLGTHAGTHIDAPSHMIVGGKTIDQFELTRFMGRGKYIDCSDNSWDIAKLEESDIQSGDIVFVYTGMGLKYHEPSYFTEYPVMTTEFAEYLVLKNVSMVGLDTCSVDNDKDFPIHKTLLGNDVLIIENLTNLEKLAGVDFSVHALPVRVDLDGAPTRVIAII